MSARNANRIIFITGSPGSGKTTLIKNILKILKQERIECRGFYTEEIRNSGSRIGFDAVSFNSNEEINDRVPLARVEGMLQIRRGPKVGKYEVDVASFEKLALKSLQQSSATLPGKSKPIIIIDEIGKMELFSKTFQEIVLTIISDQDTTLIATVPIKPNTFVDNLRSKYQPKMVNVTHTTRDGLCNEIMQMIKDLKT